MPLHQSSLSELCLRNRKFATKDKIKPWLQKILQARKGINIVIERSDSNKIIFRCKPVSKRDLEGKAVRQSTCPFRVRANYSSRNRSWSLVVINEWHDHELEPHGLVPVLSPSMEIFEGSEPKKEAILSSRTSTPKARQKDSHFKVFNSLTSDPESKLLNYILNLLTNEVNSLIKETVLDNRALSDNDKSSILRGFSSQFLNDYKNVMSPPSKPSGLNSWLSTPNTSHTTLNPNPSANLIPLTPLLNESDQDYTDTESATANTHPQAALESFTHLPGLNLNLNSNTIQLLLLIQNQAQQLPSFNSIQNQLPFSPTLGSYNGNGSSTTLNPSHLHNTTKSSSNVIFGLNEFKLNGPSTSPAANVSTDTFASSFPQTSNVMNNQSALSIPGLSSPSNNVIHNNPSTSQLMYRDPLASFAHSSHQHHGLANISDGW